MHLLTETAGDFFPRFGFRPIERLVVDMAVQQSVEFTSACPASAQVLVASLWRCLASQVTAFWSKTTRANPIGEGGSPMTVASEQLWETFSGPLQQFIRQRVPDPHSAEDILQDVFLNIHTHIDSLRMHDRLVSWIYQITRNAIADYYRAQRPSAELTNTIAAPDEPVDDDAARELSPCVAAMVEQLPEAYRQALRLTEYDGLSQKALSERLGISFSGAKSRVQRARAKIKEQLLNCCHFQFDHAGRIIDYQSRCACCSSGSCES